MSFSLLLLPSVPCLLPVPSPADPSYAFPRLPSSQNSKYAGMCWDDLMCVAERDFLSYFPILALVLRPALCHYQPIFCCVCGGGFLAPEGGFSVY